MSKTKFTKKDVVSLTDKELLDTIQNQAMEMESYHVRTFISNGIYELVKEACRRFGRWPEIVRRFGVDPVAENIADARVPMTEQQVLMEIMRLEMNGSSLKESDIADQSKILLKSARKHFITWGLALKAAGITGKKP